MNYLKKVKELFKCLKLDLTKCRYKKSNITETLNIKPQSRIKKQKANQKIIAFGISKWKQEFISSFFSK